MHTVKYIEQDMRNRGTTSKLTLLCVFEEQNKEQQPIKKGKEITSREEKR